MIDIKKKLNNAWEWTKRKTKVIVFSVLGIGVAFAAITSGDISPITEIELINSIKIIQDAEFIKSGKYKHIPKTDFIGEFPSTYQVDERQHPDGTKSYRITIKHFEDESVWNATTSKYEIIPVLKQTIQTIK